MSDLFEKSIKTLELPAVLELLSRHAVSDEAKARCLRLRPVTDAAAVEHLLDETDAAKTRLGLHGSPSFAGVKDVSQALNRADHGGVLNTRELLDVTGVLTAARRVSDYDAERQGEATAIDRLFSALHVNRYLEDRIRSAILDEETIADTASPELADIRRKMRAAATKGRQILQRIISSPSYAKVLQEALITQRDGRFVVPVKAECKGSLPGLVHDISSSGATLFVEPMGVVQANNELIELEAKEQQEIERILAELSADCANYRTHIEENYRVLVTLDCIFARAKLSFAMNAIEPQIRTDGALELKRARHPLIDKQTVVPISVRLGTDFDTLIITGPNTGGKTVTLKTIGLLTLMAECGLHVPADDGSFVSVFPLVLADIGDEQSIEQSLSTFSAHMKNIVEIVSVCDRESLVLLDELGAGTDPAEGAALAVALIEFCRQCGAKVAATTHYAELKIYAMRTEGVINASCEFDVETLKPTYRLLIGIPGKSNAFAISRRLGLPEHIIDKARSMVNENDTNFEDVLNQLEQQRQEMERARAEAEHLRLETEKQKKQSEQYYNEIKLQREKAAQQAKKEAQFIIDDARRTANQVYEELKQLRKQAHDSADVQNQNERQAALRRTLNEAEEKLAGGEEKKPRPKSSREIRVGDTVELIKYGSRATVLAIGKDGTYQLQAGIMKVNAKADEIYLLENQPKGNVKKVIEGKVRELKAAVSPELDLRGMAVDEALPVLDNFLDSAFLANLPSVRIIHGKGTGVLRSAVQDELRRSKYIKSFRLGVYGEGESGVTIAEFK